MKVKLLYSFQSIALQTVGHIFLQMAPTCVNVFGLNVIKHMHR